VFGPVTLEVNQTVGVDFALHIGAASDSVRVEAGSEIPWNGRSWQQLIDLSAGANPPFRQPRTPRAVATTQHPTDAVREFSVQAG
jgi:hypothetical protein